jgi:hypothetical protein
MEIRSYRSVFDLERRIYRVDRLRLNPAGVPVRGVIYALALIAAALICGKAPALQALMRMLPWYLSYVALPVSCAALLTVVAIDGRPFHLAAQALLRYRCQPRQSVGLRMVRAGSGAQVGARWWPQEILVLPDGSDAHMRRLRYTGPGAVLVSVAHVCEGSRRRHSRRIGRSPVTLRERSSAGMSAGVAVGASALAGAERGGGKVIALSPDATLRTG